MTLVTADARFDASARVSLARRGSEVKERRGGRSRESGPWREEEQKMRRRRVWGGGVTRGVGGGGLIQSQCETVDICAFSPPPTPPARPPFIM